MRTIYQVTLATRDMDPQNVGFPYSTREKAIEAMRTLVKRGWPVVICEWQDGKRVSVTYQEDIDNEPSE